MMKMYEGIPFSPTAELTGVVAVDDTVISVSNTACFPPAPNYATIGIDENAETILYSQKTQNTLSGCTRGVEGIPKKWEQGELIARNFTNQDYKSLMDNINNKANKNLLVNENLLINGDFRIWQRGTSFEISDSRYTADRWITHFYSNISKSNNGLLIKGNYVDGLGGISQILTREEVGDISGSLTCSFLSRNFVPINLEINIDGVITNQLTGTSTNFIKSSITFHLPDNFQRLKLSLIAGSGGVPSSDLAEIKWCKLEVGECVTPFVPRPLAQELALCQRYYLKKDVDMYSTNDTMIAVSDKILLGTISFPIVMRIRPTITFNDGVCFRSNNTGQILYKPLSVNTQHGIYGINAIFGVTFSSSSFVINDTYAILFEADAEIY